MLELDELDRITISTKMRKYRDVPLELSVELSRKEEEKPGVVIAFYLLASKLSDDGLVIFSLSHQML